MESLKKFVNKLEILKPRMSAKARIKMYSTVA
jgi:hypothetical protein